MNVLWIMCDQLRYDYLSCAGHPTLKTPNIDGLAKRGVRFDRAYVQSPICGPSRMCSYTGRYCRSHGSTWNGFPLRIGERTLGDHLRDIGVNPVLVGKTHMVPDEKGMEWLGIDPASVVGVHHSECGFEPFERDDGLHPDGPMNDFDLPYNRFLRERNYGGDNPWHEWANSVEDDEGNQFSGWLMRYNNLPARVPAELSETPYLTQRAMDFIEGAGDQPWLCHLSYIKPHWPYVAPAPYNAMYSADDILPVNRTDAERDPETAHPVFKAFQDSRFSRGFTRDGVRETVIPVYMGLIKQIDDEIGRLLAFLEERGRLKDTMIVFSSDHGDYLGDHWMGEKDLFHDASVRAPLIIYDPRAEADATRGQVRDELVEYIDLAPTFISFFGGKALPHILEGRDLNSILHDDGQQPVPWREYAISEYDYSVRDVRLNLGVDQEDARLTMVCDARWKYIHAEGFRPMLFDLVSDPNELNDLGDDPDHEEERARLFQAMCAWQRWHHNRVTISSEDIERRAGKESPGILIAVWDEEDLERHSSRQGK